MHALRRFWYLLVFPLLFIGGLMAYSLYHFYALKRHADFVPGVITDKWERRGFLYYKYQFELKDTVFEHIGSGVAEMDKGDTVVVVYNSLAPQYNMLVDYQGLMPLNWKDLDQSKMIYSWWNFTTD